MSSGTHSFRGRSMPEAVAKLKAALGSDAVIVRTSRGEDAKGKYVEITATGTLKAAPGPASPRAERPVEEAPAMGGRLGASAAYARTARKPAPGPFAERAALLARTLADTQGEPPRRPAVSAPAPSATIPPASSELVRLREEIAALREIVDGMGRGLSEEAMHEIVGAVAAQVRELRGLVAEDAELPGESRVVRDRLVALGVSGSHAADVARRVAPRLADRTADDAEVLGLIGRQLAEDLKCAGDLMPARGERRLLAFVGPTGVGKTTTIGKIAARAKLLHKVPVALVTLDTFRMAAVEQLARYAEILECPLKVVNSPADLERALHEVADYPLVLVDTTGRSPRAQDQVEALAKFLPPAWGGEIVLTVACGTRERDLVATTTAFDALGYRYLCVTKMDETDAPGAVYSLARRTGRPLAWLTNGQRVPEDLEVADQVTLAARLATRTVDRAREAVAC